jgi:hypothetical protein
MDDILNVVFGGDARDERGVAGVADDKSRRRMNGFAAAGRKIIEHDDSFAGVDEREHRVTSNIASAAGDQNGHEMGSPRPCLTYRSDLEIRLRICGKSG